jgi:hypothetical protein
VVAGRVVAGDEGVHRLPSQTWLETGRLSGAVGESAP